jgi:hypothetical protein
MPSVDRQRRDLVVDTGRYAGASRRQGDDGAVRTLARDADLRRRGEGDAENGAHIGDELGFVRRPPSPRGGRGPRQDDRTHPYAPTGHAALSTSFRIRELGKRPDPMSW